MKVFVVLNPVAGRTQPGEIRKVLRRHFGSPDWQLDIYETSADETIGEVVRKAIADGAERVFAAGGDGTISAVVDGLVGTGVPLGIIPSGTGNVLAQELNIPLDIDKACRLLAETATTRDLDALKVKNRFYILSIGTGADAMTIEQTGRKHKRRFGRLAYIAAMFKVLVGIQPHRFALTIDGQKKHVRAADVLVTNISTLSKPIRWGRHIRPDDGMIDICVIRARNLVDVVLVAWDMIWPGPPREDRNLRFLVAKEHVHITTEKPVSVQGDGEVLGKTPVKAVVVVGAVKVLVAEGNQQQRLMNLPTIPELARGLDKVKKGIVSQSPFGDSS
ncbi:MAG: diacylglycerol kinase family protein [Candidatus Promineifilaceae bacterium]